MENTKNPITEAERLELAAKLDKELDEFIDSLPQREKQPQIPFERWEEELTNHPFFLKQDPQPGDKLHPLYEGLQKLKYDPDENEPEELAISYKEDGNFSFKHQKYRMAIISYTEGIKIKCGTPEVEATLYNNRSAAHFYLKNYKSSLEDCENALKIRPTYLKALTRAAECCYRTQKYEKCVEFCDKVLDLEKTHEEILELRKKCINESKIKERDRRKRDLLEKKAKLAEQEVVNEILKRQIRIDGVKGGTFTITQMEPQFPQLFSCRVSLNENQQLIWPVILFYPEYKIMDYIQEFNESSTFLEQLEQVFEHPPEWDITREYTPGGVNVYFEDETRKNIKIDTGKTLLEILQLKQYVVKEGTPRFIVLVAGSRVEAKFLSS